ncbi:hypothetical protein TELCIR_01986 [Teladorsagia circumcincta]|uniref:Uncharacterized protein n=1 Tax=Teladorsagia circumcincta TaxID=45464 RepID=A0A2G9V0E2_TELCI|nr:hypothetical protein TELCIR_01986 [Teladorsagia circumcincta]
MLDELPSTESPQEYRQRLDNFFVEITESFERVLAIVANAPALAVAMKRPWSTVKQLGDIQSSIGSCDIREVTITKEVRVSSDIRTSSQQIP